MTKLPEGLPADIRNWLIGAGVLAIVAWISLALFQAVWVGCAQRQRDISVQKVATTNDATWIVSDRRITSILFGLSLALAIVVAAVVWACWTMFFLRPEVTWHPVATLVLTGIALGCLLNEGWHRWDLWVREPRASERATPLDGMTAAGAAATTIPRLASYWTPIALLVAVLWFMCIAFPWRAEIVGATALDVSFGYSRTDVEMFAMAAGPDGRSTYVLSEWSLDLLFPILYAGCLSLFIQWGARAWQMKTSVWRWLRLLPVLVMGLDYLENGVLSRMMSTYPDGLDSVWLASIVTQAKFGSFAVTLLVCLVVLLGGGIGWARRAWATRVEVNAYRAAVKASRQQASTANQVGTLSADQTSTLNT